MACDSKHTVLYKTVRFDLDFPEGADRHAFTACRYAVEGCHQLLRLLIERNCIDGVRYMLENGVPLENIDFHYLEKQLDAVGPGISEANWAMAKLLRKHNAPIFPYIVGHCESSHPMNLLGFTESWQTAQALPYWKELLKIQREPYVAYQYYQKYHKDLGDDNQGAPEEVLARWPPEGVQRTMPLSVQALDATLSLRIARRLSTMWDTIKLVRQDEAKRLSPYNWHRARTRMRMRAIAMYWWGETQKRVCAPGGTGQKRDLAAFQAEFV